MKILITNNALISRTGSELYVKEIGEKLSRRGHQVAAYSNYVGDLAESMRQAGIEVVDDLARLAWQPDIIHGQHHLEAMTAIAHFSDSPVFYLNHGWRPWQEKPPLHPRILKYGAVDTMTLDFALENGVPRDRIALLHNFVDLDRFTQRGPLPHQPVKALVFSNYASAGNYLPAVTRAGEKAGIELDAIGELQGNASESPEKVLKDYDLIFAKGRCALEALATGAAVILCDEMGVGPMVTTGNMEQLRDRNFGVAAFYSEMDADVLYREISNYDAADTAGVTARLREEIGIDAAVEGLERLYQETIDTFSDTRIDREDENRAFSAYLREKSLFIKSNEIDHMDRAQVIVQKDLIIEQKEIELSQLREQIHHLQAGLENISRAHELVISSRTWRLRNRLDSLRRVFKR